MSGCDLAALRAGTLLSRRQLRIAAGLTRFPDEILDLADTLEVLDLSGNALTTLPPDFARLRRLRVLFFSDNRFRTLPPVLGDCPSLSQIGARRNGMRHVPPEALPPRLRWLTLTENAIETLPEALGDRPALQKLMLSGNRIATVPDRLQGAQGLELLRLSANRIEALPGWVVELPCLAWLAWGGNPGEPAAPPPSVPPMRWDDLVLETMLGEGASGQVWRAVPRAGGAPVAVKLFKGAMTSDGLPDREIAACLAAGPHPGLVGARAELLGHPEGRHGLVLDLLPPDWRVLAAPPSLDSCSRDVWDAGLTLSPLQALGIARDVAAGAAHLHKRGLLHGDLYAHNILWDGDAGAARLSDLGAAAVLPARPSGLDRLDVLALGILIGELAARCTGALPPAVEALGAACRATRAEDRPSMAAAAALLARPS